MFEIFDKNTGEVVETVRDLAKAREYLADYNVNHDADMPLYGMRMR